MNPGREAILREMGLGPVWRLRAGPQADAPAPLGQVDSEVSRPPVGLPPCVDHPEVSSSPALNGVEGEGWDGLIARIDACRACSLGHHRRQAVPGVGDRRADWLIVGEGPGAEEDLKGEPFVGQAGKLLDAMLATIGLERGKGVFIANAVKCRPPHNRTPEAEEVAACKPFLARQIELIAPRLIVALGRPAAQALLDQEVKIASARGRQFYYQQIPVLVTYHPAYLLRNPHDKAKAWEDLCFARRTMDQLRRQAGD